MKKKDYLTYLGLMFSALVSRAPFVERFQSHWDGPQYSIGVVRFSFEQATPAPPGYPLYIGLGKIFNLVFNEPHYALLAVSVFASMIAVAVIYFVGSKFYNRIVGLTAAFIYLSGSTFYYFGLTPYAYGLLPITMLLLAYVVYRIFILRKQEGLLLGIIFAICFGIRPQETIQNGPLFLLGFIFLNNKQKLIATLPIISITLAWLLPLISITGGLNNYIAVNTDAAKAAFPHFSILHTSELMIKGFLLSFGLAAGFLLYYPICLYRKQKELHWKLILFYAIWLIPGLYYNLFVRTEHAGYQMSYLSGFLILISYAMWQVTRKSKFLLTISIVIISLFNLFWFLYNRDPQYIKPYRPTSFHYSDIRKNDLKVGSKVSFIQKNFNPQSTALITTDTLWRPYMYHLKQFHLITLGALNTNDLPFKYNRFDAYEWSMKQSEDKDLNVIIPPQYKTIVFMDDEAYMWIKNYKYQKYNLSGNSSITSIHISTNTEILYKYHSILIK